ncbi:DNA internalization-related competence protein ComEC/Rec2 [Litchfieldia alkalitelluris]|uniref:DNA internalization-related competence protein ComEC/Rec2 n=1 Tax=Litchfieldia alkalitelluris TaxID=304268 RepID=UPI000996976B|nr:DNA internalization-related competence protein ComEC/Rec2 [Litchfieldia alkalitelluris]
MNKQINYLLPIYKSLVVIWDNLKGQHVYLAFSVILGILVPYFHGHFLMIFVTFLYLTYLFLQKKRTFLSLSFITILSFTIYFVIVDQNNHSILQQEETDLMFEIISPIHFDGSKLSTTIKTAEGEKLQLAYFAKSEKELHKLTNQSIGTRCSLSGELIKPAIARNPNAFNYREYLYQKKIHWIFQPRNWSVEQCQKSKQSLKNLLINQRLKGIQLVEAYYPIEVVGIVQALIFGERKQIEEDVLASYQSLGLVHLLAISGLHVSFITAMLFYVLIKVGITRERTSTILLIFLPFYTIVAGGAPSVIRACLMASLFIISVRWRSKLSPLDALSIACGVMLLYNPYVLFNVGFQLSFIVTFSLVLSSRFILKNNSYVVTLVKVSVIAQLGAFPVILYYFYEISFISIPLNIVFVPLYSIIILPLTLLSLIVLIIFAPLGKILVGVISFIIKMVNFFVVWVSEGPNTIVFGKPSLIIIICYVITIFILFLYWELNKKLQKALLSLGIVTGLHLFSPYLNPYGQVTMLDIGQGDTIYIELPFRRAVYLLDVTEVSSFEQEDWKKRKNQFSVSKEIILPFLKSRGVKSIDKLIITHGDFDHMGGAETIIDHVNVEELVLGETKEKNELEKLLIEKARKNNIPLQFVGRGDYWSESNYSFYVLAPMGEEATANNQSIVLYTKLGTKSWLFTGDLEEEGEQAFVAGYQMVVDVLKIGHHGSKTSSTEIFIDQLKPKIGLISVGKNNRYGHPDDQVIERLTEKEVKVLRTDLNGAITFHFTKKGGTFSVMIP